MTIAVIGSRNFTDYQKANSFLNEFNNSIPIGKIVSGGAQGADKIGVRWAKENNLSFQELVPDWNNVNVVPCKVKYNKFGKPYNALAGFNCNKIIVDSCDIVVAFWDGRSSGTKDSIDYAEKLGKETIVVKF